MADEDENEKAMAEAMKQAAEGSNPEKTEGLASAPNPEEAKEGEKKEGEKKEGAELSNINLTGAISQEMAKAKTKFIRELADDVQEGDDALNKLKIQNIDFILDVPLKVSVELGRAKVLIKDLLQLGQGSVLELDKLAGEALEILVNGKLIARGEVVVVNEKFGIRIKEIISPVERIDTLR